MRNIMVIADDFALTPAVSAGILALLEQGRLSGTGVMTNRPDWRDSARPLRGIKRIDFGVHLNLTLGRPLSPMRRLAPGGELPSPRRLALALATDGDAIAEIEAEIMCQLDAFAQTLGRPPDFIDGHQHMHVVPGIRSALFSVLGRVSLTPRPWLRDPADTPTRILTRGIAVAKAEAVAALAGGFGRAARSRGFRVNRGFSGFSAFDPKRTYAADFRRYLLAPGPTHLIMCHPGRIDDELRDLDPAVTTRPRELAYFESTAFLDDLAGAECRLSRFSRDVEPPAKAGQRIRA